MKQDPRYTDLMQEIKERLYTIEDVLSGRTALQGPLAHEFCFLQLRIICECISYACVIAHAYLKELQAPKFQKAWSADVLTSRGISCPNSGCCRSSRTCLRRFSSAVSSGIPENGFFSETRVKRRASVVGLWVMDSGPTVEVISRASSSPG